MKIKELAQKFNRSRSSIHRIINKRRAHKILSTPISYIPSDEFFVPDAEKKLLQGDIDTILNTNPAERPASAASSAHSLLTRPQEAELFRRYNFLKFLAKELAAQINPVNPSGKLLQQIENYLSQADQIKKIIIEANIGLVVNIAKKHAASTASLQDLVSEGHLSLIKAVDNFDYTRGYRFSTYAAFAISKDFARRLPELSHRQLNEEIDIAQFRQDLPSPEPAAIERAHKSLEQIIKENLTERQQFIIRNHFGLHGNRITNKRMTLKQIGDHLGISKERVRQIELLALHQLRKCLSPEEFDQLTK